jgi:transketolase
VSINTIRALSIDAVQQAKSGHASPWSRDRSWDGERYVGATGQVIGMTTFGAAA